MAPILSAILFFLSFLAVGASASVFLGLNKNRSILEWFALSLGLGLVFLPPLFFAVSYLAGGVQAWIPYGMAGVSLALFLALVWKGKAPRPSLNRSEAVLLGIVALYVSILFLYLSTYAVFPDAGTVHDYVANLIMLNLPQWLLYGWGTTTIYGVTQLTSAFYMLYGVMSLQVNQVLALRYSMVLVAAFVPLIVYYLSLSLFKDKEASLFATAAYSFVFPFWLVGVLSTGLYAQFYAGILFCVLLWLVSEYFEGRVSLWAPAAVALLLPFAHPTSFLFLAMASLSCALVYAASKRRDDRYWKVAAVCGAPVLAALSLVVSLGLLSHAIKLAAPGGTFYYAPDALTPYISWSPFLLVIESFDGPLGLGLVLCTALLGLLAVFRRSFDRRHAIVLGWFWLTWLASLPFGGLHTASRYVIFAFPACSLMLGLFFLWIVKPLRTRLGWYSGKGVRLNRASFYLVVVVLFLILSIQGASGQALASSVPSHTLTSTKQNDILQSMLWVKNNTGPNAVVVSVSLPEYAFLPFIANRTYAGDVVGPPSVLRDFLNGSSLAHSSSGGEIPVYVALFSLLHNSTTNFYKLYSLDGSYTLIWNSTDVAVFRYG